MTRFGFTLQPRWFGYLGMAIVFAIACVLLSQWQFGRLDEARREIERIDTNYAKSPQQLGDVLPSLTSWDVAVEWTPVSLTGTYLVDDQLLVRNRPYNGNPGFEVLTPLKLSDGSVFVVDRGWLPSGDTQDKPDVVPAPPSGVVTVVARVKQGEPDLPGRSAPAGEIPSIDLAEVATEVGQPTYTGGYGLMESESPATATRPLPAIKPEEDEGPHLSYAIQWIIFAFFGFVGLGYAIRQEYRARRSGNPDDNHLVAAPKEKRRRTDAQIEDELAESGARISR